MTGPGAVKWSAARGMGGARAGFVPRRATPLGGEGASSSWGIMASMRDGFPAALQVFVFALLGGLGSGYLAFRLVLLLPPRLVDRPERLVVALLLAAAVGVAGAVTSGVVAGKRVRR